MNALRILACAFTCCPPGKPGFSGGEDVLGWNLIQQIARNHNVWVLTNAQDRPSIEEALQDSPILNLNFYYVGLPRWLHPLLNFQGTHQLYYHVWQVKAYFCARRAHRQHQFHLFHHITYANDWSASFIGAFLPIPYVRGPGGGAHSTPKGFGTEYPLGGRIWEKIRTIGQWIFRHDPFFIRGQSRAKAILICNKDSETKIPEKWRQKVHWFPVSGVSSEDLNLETSDPSDDQFRIVTAGSLLRIKGFSLAIRAFQQFATQYPESQFCIIGSGPEEARLRRIARQSTVNDNLKFIQAMPRRQLLTEMANANVFLFPSLRDGGGTVVIEAMSLGKPVICLDAGGPGTHITDECGIKITPTTPQQATNDLAVALENLYLDRDLRIRLGGVARDRAEEFYHWDKLGDRLMKIYQRATNSTDDS